MKPETVESIKRQLMHQLDLFQLQAERRLRLIGSLRAKGYKLRRIRALCDEALLPQNLGMVSQTDIRAILDEE